MFRANTLPSRACVKYPRGSPATALSITETSNGDGSSDWVVRYELDFDPMDPEPDALYAAFSWWNEPPIEDHTFAGSTVDIYSDD